ncbi:MAG: tRNA pseudouridine(38-40) synthase TruA [Desulfobacterales bacterium]|jgi:tRNA pseudouridine38-40 synthase|nr:tRNA pseudouridine(38-40) synthase TruA [Desulfobacterales bacterium]MDZ7597251.1 tRNA pseudouridine(38-40) synthase TruA [Desulfobacterales bacterium]
MAKNFKLLIEYDGTRFHGWQRQKQDRTVQAEIEAALAVMTRQAITLNGSGRTDAGVHALGQVANFCCDTRLTASDFLKGLNRLLSADVVIRGCESAATDFHARYDAKGKTYCYRILNRPLPAAIGRQYAWHIRSMLDLTALQQAARFFVGRHDFKAFEGAGSPRTHTIRDLRRVAVLPGADGRIDITFEADGFLRFMVRNITGTLVAVGLGKRPPEAVQAILRSRDRAQAAATAPACGLFLVAVHY